MRRLYYALAVWKEGTFVKAAERVHISQPAISEQVRQLELEIGFEIFRRTGQGVEATDAGLAFLLEAEEVYLKLEQLSESADLLRGTKAGVFSVGLSSSVTALVAPSLVRALHNLKPTLLMEISTLSTRRIYKRLREEEIDIGITVETSPRVLPPDLHAEKIASDRMTLIVPKSHPLANAGRVIMSDFPRDPLVMTELSVGYSEVVKSLFSEMGIHNDVAAVCDNFQTIVELVAAGAGISMVPEKAVSTESSRSAIAVVELEPAKEVNIVMVSRVTPLKGSARRYAEAIKGWILEHIKSNESQGPARH
jgi:DNA-binding transcriptional LysR family regulator